MKKFDEEKECIKYLTTKLESKSTSKELVETVAKELSKEFVEGKRTKGGFGLAINRWVIRDEDLKFFDLISAVGLAIVGVGTGVAEPLAVANVFVAVVKIIRNALSKGIQLNQDQQLLLILLKSNKSICWTKEEIVNYFSSLQQVKLQNWTNNKVEDILSQLSEMRCSDGTVISIVEKDGKGCWGTSGI
jgi:hypothetical protein